MKGLEWVPLRLVVTETRKRLDEEGGLRKREEEGSDLGRGYIDRVDYKGSVKDRTEVRAP